MFVNVGRITGRKIGEDRDKCYQKIERIVLMNEFCVFLATNMSM